MKNRFESLEVSGLGLGLGIQVRGYSSVLVWEVEINGPDLETWEFR